MKRAAVSCLLGLLVLTSFAGLSAQQPAPAQPTAQPTEQPPPSSEKKETTGYTLSPEKYEKAVAYARARYWLYFIGFAYGLLLLYVVLRLRLAPKFRDWAEAASRVRFVQALIYVPVLTLVLAVLGLPTDLYGQWLSLTYEQSIQSWGSWFWDWTKGQLISIVISVILVWILYAAVRRSPRRWWFYFWLAAIPIIILLVFLSPLVIDPLFFQFEPLEKTQPALVVEIEKVVQRGGLTIPRERMFEMKASEKMKSVNAYVTGFGASKRVVFWDTTLQKMSQGQGLFVFGHEMGHYVLGHIYRSIAFIAAVLLLFLFLGFKSMHWALARWGDAWGIRGVDDWASLPVLMLFLSAFSFLFSPIGNSFSRYQEHEADIYGLEVIHGIVPDSPEAAAQAFQVLGEINLADPNPHPLIRIWLYSHPPLDDRIRFAHSYDPWSKGEPTQFVDGR
ncbi:MAG: M48 family metallopeptidase [Acidobacteria bacterium]|nr:M48 family metallopeptidase [Acidobacteriota bacterium]